MLFAMAEIMLQVIALGFEGIVVFVFDLPAGAPASDQVGDVFAGDFEIGDESVMV